MTEQAPSPTRSPLRLLCVGTGRDGTMSLAHMISYLQVKGGLSGTVLHEYGSRAFYNLFARFKETGDPGWKAEVYALIDECRHEAIVGNGYASILPQFAERCGPELVLVHLKRMDKRAAIKSLRQNCELFPFAYANYLDNPHAPVKRMTAVHFGEMSDEEWKRLPLDEKLIWYYDKTHELVDEYQLLFPRRVEIATESLNDQSTREKIAELVLGNTSLRPLPTRINAHMDVEWLPDNLKTRVQWMLGRLNLYELATDDAYPLDFWTDTFIAWTRQQILRSPREGSDVSNTENEPARSSDEIASTLDKAETILKRRLKEIEQFRHQLASRG